MKKKMGMGVCERGQGQLGRKKEMLTTGPKLAGTGGGGDEGVAGRQAAAGGSHPARPQGGARAAAGGAPSADSAGGHAARRTLPHPARPPGGGAPNRACVAEGWAWGGGGSAGVAGCCGLGCRPAVHARAAAGPRR